MKYDLNSYKSSSIFSYIINDLSLINEMLNESFLTTLTSFEETEEILEKQRISLIGDNLDAEIYTNYYDQLKNDQLKNYIINSGLLYYYSQFEIKLLNICERLPLINENCQDIYEFLKSRKLRSKSNLDRITRFIKDETDINIKTLNNWQRINDFKEVRNSIAHNERISSRKIDTFRAIAGRNGNKILLNNNLADLIINKTYLFEIIDISLKFIDQLLNEIWNKNQN